MTRRRAIAVGAAVAVLALTVWAVVGAAAVLAAYDDLKDGRDELRAAASALRSAELVESRAHLDAAVRSATAASSRLNGPAVWPLRIVPIVSPNLAVARTLSDGVVDVGTPAVSLLDEASTIVHDRSQTVEFGRVPIEYLVRVQGDLAATSDALTATLDRVRRGPEDGLLGPIESARTSFLELAEPVADQLRAGVALTEVMPAFLGQDEPRRYLVVASALSELRGSTGLLGAYALLTIDDGVLQLTAFEDSNDLPTQDEPVELDAGWYHDRWSRYGGDRVWRNTNLSPDFPAAARAMTAVWEARPGAPELDGVIVTDANVYQRLVERSGDIEVPGVVTLTASNTLPFVGIEAYAAFDDQTERKRVLGAVAAASFQRLIGLLEDEDVPATVEMLSDLSRGGNLLIYSDDPTVQAGLERGGVAGRLPSEAGEYAAIVVNNVAGNKVDYFTTRTVEHRVGLEDDGVTSAQVAVTFSNGAPRDGLPRHVLGPWTDETSAGDNLSLVTFLCGVGCEVVAAPDGAETRGVERELPATDLRTSVDAGARRTLEYRTRTPDAWHRSEDGTVHLTVRHRRQPTIADQSVTVRVTVPRTFRAGGAPEGSVVEGDEIVWRGSGPRDVTLRYRFVPIRSER